MAAAKSSPCPSLLIVDDEAAIRDLCGQALCDYRVRHASHGQAALDIMARETIDIVLTDVMMPVMNGLDLLRSIKEQSPDQAVIMMTGFGDKEVILRALKTGADDFIQKPINLLQLKTAVTKTLEKKALREELVRLKLMDRLKSDFLGLVSHKLKTPVTVISLFLQDLAHDDQAVLAADFTENLEMVLEETRYLSTLIHDLLDFSHFILRDTPTEPELKNPRQLIHDCLQGLQEYADQRNLTINCSMPDQLPELLIDGRKIYFALRAVVENALKFSPTGGNVDLEVSTDDREIHIRIIDDGPGIPRDEQQKIFERFYQIDPDSTGQVRGLGMGLFYARQFVQEQGGAILLHNHPTRGTAVTLCLPIRPQATLG